MASKDRMIVPFVCDCCGAPLRRKKSACEFCRVEWEMVKRYEGPEIPSLYMGAAWTTASMTFATANCSFPTLISANYGTPDCDY